MAKKQTRKKTAARGKAKGGTARRGAGARKTARKKTARKAVRKQATRGRARTTARGGGARKRPSSARKTSGRAGGGQLSRSTRSAEWIESAGERDTPPGQTLATRSHDVIQQWAEERGGEPSTIPGADAEQPRVLRFNFPGFGGENLQPVSWEDWFRTFDDRNLVFVFQDRLKNGNQSNFFRFDSPDREDA